MKDCPFKNKECNAIRIERDRIGLQYSRAQRLLDSIYSEAMNGTLTPKRLISIKNLIEELGPC